MTQLSEAPADLRSASTALQPTHRRRCRRQAAMGYLAARDEDVRRQGLLVQVDPNEIPGIEAMGVPELQEPARDPGRDRLRRLRGPAPRRRAHHRRLHREEGRRRRALYLGLRRDRDRRRHRGAGADHADGARLRPAPHRPELHGHLQPPAGRPAQQRPDRRRRRQRRLHLAKRDARINFSLVGAVRGVKCSKTVSFGNAVVLDAPDYIEYLADDPETEVIAMYIEGMKDGQRFFRVLKRGRASASPSSSGRAA